MTFDELFRIPLTTVVEAQEHDNEWVRVATIEELPGLSVVGEDMDELIGRTERERLISLAELAVHRGWTPDGSPLMDTSVRAALLQADLVELLPYLELDIQDLPVGLVEQIRGRIGGSSA